MNKNTIGRHTRSRAMSMMKMNVVTALSSVPVDSANAQSLQLAAKFCGADEVSGTLANLILKDPRKLSPMDRTKLRTFLHNANVFRVPLYPAIGDFYDDGEFTVEFYKNKAARNDAAKRLMHKIANHALYQEGVRSLKALNRNETELEVDFRGVRGNEWEPNMEFKVGADGLLYCMLFAKDIDGDVLLSGKFLREKNLRQEIDRVGRAAKWPVKLVKSLHKFVDTLGRK